uniref:Uncharacterized protein n=1 Tax=Eptatretus burgeri TaxID=7764 RepID=A0A8C4QHI4_EPTBU
MSSVYSALHINKDDFSCVVCMEIFADPVTLNCGHTFCLRCIESVWDNRREDSGFCCPTCRTLYTQKPRLSTNVVLQVSDGEPMYSLEVTTSVVVDDAKCWDHDEPLKFYCKQDGVLVCMLCISTGKHQNHLFSSAEREYKERKELEDVLKQLKQKTRSLVAEIESRSCNMEGKLKHVQATEANLQLCLDNEAVLSFLMVKRVLLTICNTKLIEYGQPQTLDMKTAHPQLLLSNDLTTVTASETWQSYPDLPQRYDCLWQVLGISTFSSGRHYWEVDASRARYCRIGVAYPGIQRKGESADCWLGENPFSWCLLKYNATLSAWHDGVKAPVSTIDPPMKIGLLLDNEAGTLRFYQVETMKLIHAFHATFSQSLCPALWISGDGDSLSINGRAKEQHHRFHIKHLNINIDNNKNNNPVIVGFPCVLACRCSAGPNGLLLHPSSFDESRLLVLQHHKPIVQICIKASQNWYTCRIMYSEQF